MIEACNIYVKAEKNIFIQVGDDLGKIVVNRGINITMNIKEIGQECLNWIRRVQGKDHLYL
jgi:hypothetical protein